MGSSDFIARAVRNQWRTLSDRGVLRPLWLPHGDRLWRGQDRSLEPREKLEHLQARSDGDLDQMKAAQ